MVDSKFREKNYMVENRITHIISNGLAKHIKNGNVKCYPTYNIFRFVFYIDDWLFEISYFFIDDYYKIKMENNHLQKVIFLTKCKKFHRDIKQIIKGFKLSKKSFENHIVAFIANINQALEKHENLNYVDETYISDLNFDGIFI